jgi:hypothetical protein
MAKMSVLISVEFETRDEVTAEASIQRIPGEPSIIFRKADRATRWRVLCLDPLAWRLLESR